MTWEESLIDQEVGHYRLVERLGAGGMGAVFLGEHPTVESRVAIKILHEAHLTDLAIGRRLVDEARAVNMVGHPGLVRIHDCDSQEGLGLYLVMEYLRGQTLFERFEQRGAFMPYLMARLLRQAATALAAAHQAGIIHRDLKPSNLFLVDDPEAMGGLRVKVLDFGVAKLLGDDEAMGELTATGMIIGSPQYMSPEQCLDSKSVDNRTDIFSLGVIGYTLLCGRLPFPGANVGQVLLAHRAGPAQPLRQLRREVPEALERCIMSALALEREERLGSMEEMERQLDAVVKEGEASGAVEAEAAAQEQRGAGGASGTLMDQGAAAADEAQPALSTKGLLAELPGDEGTLILDGEVEDLVSGSQGDGLHDASTVMLDGQQDHAQVDHEQPTVMLSMRTAKAAEKIEGETIIDPDAVLGADEEPAEELDQAILKTLPVDHPDHVPGPRISAGVIVAIIAVLAAVGATVLFLM